MTDDTRADADSSADTEPSHATNGQGSSEVAVVQRATVETSRYRRNLEQPWHKSKLIAQLAQGDKTHAQLAEEYGCGRTAITMFKQRHQSAIEERAEQTSDEFSDLWIANKRHRLATLMEAAEKLAAKPDARSAEVLAKLLKDAAEELGDLPTRAGVQINTANVEYNIVGVGLDALT